MKALTLVAFILSSSPALAATITPQDAASHIGQTVTVEGVAHVHVARTATFIDMGGTYPNEAFQAVAFPDHASGFGDLMRYDGKTVDVTGQVREYNGIPEIILDKPSQLRAR